jgi:hypothetical protein
MSGTKNARLHILGRGASLAGQLKKNYVKKMLIEHG